MVLLLIVPPKQFHPPLISLFVILLTQPTCIVPTQTIRPRDNCSERRHHDDTYGSQLQTEITEIANGGRWRHYVECSSDTLSFWKYCISPYLFMAYLNLVTAQISMSKTLPLLPTITYILFIHSELSHIRQYRRDSGVRGYYERTLLGIEPQTL